MKTVMANLVRLPLTRPDVALALALAVIASVAFATLKLVSEIAEGETGAFDRMILVAVRDATGGRSPLLNGLRTVMLDLTALGNGVTLTIVVILVTGYLAVAGRRSLAIFLAAQVVVGTSLVAIMKALVGRDRPDVVTHLVDVSSASFPSGHAADSAIVYLSLAMLIARVTQGGAARLYVFAAAMALTLCIGLSRIYLGVHWPSDVLAGWAIGAGWAMAVALLAQWLHLRRADAA